MLHKYVRAPSLVALVSDACFANLSFLRNIVELGGVNVAVCPPDALVSHHFAQDGPGSKFGPPHRFLLVDTQPILSSFLLAPSSSSARNDGSTPDTLGDPSPEHALEVMAVEQLLFLLRV